MSNESREPSLLSSAARTLLDWGVLVLMMLLPALIHNYAIVFSTTCGVGLFFLGLNGYRHSQGTIKVFPKLFEVGTLLINLGLMIYEFVAEPSRDWSRNWTSVIIQGSLLVVVLFTILIKKPFTLQFAMEKVPEQFWESETFFTVSYIISWVWALQFALSLMFSLLYVFVYNDNDLLRVIPGIVVLILTLQFTAKFPAYMKDRSRQTTESGDRLLAD